MILPNFGEQPTETIEATPVRTEEVETATENQFLDFSKHKVQPITLEQLKSSNLENRGDDRECPHGIYHCVLIEQLLDMCEKHGYTTEVQSLFATNNRDKQANGTSVYPELEAVYGERAVKATTLRRVFANIRIKNFDDDELTTNLAVSYTQRGIQVGFGSMVKVCTNQNMMGKGCFASDYSTHNRYANDPYKTDLKGIFAKVETWLTDTEHIVITDREEIEKMKQAVISADDLYKILGLLFTIRVQTDTDIKRIKYKGDVYPLNQSQLVKFDTDLLCQQKDKGQITAWDFYNAATNLYKPTDCEQNNIMPQNLSMMRFIKKYHIYETANV